MSIKNSKKSKNGQLGAVLIVVLSMILLLTIMSLSSMAGSGIRERMAGNERDFQIAFQSAESGLRDAENFVVSVMTPSASFIDNTCSAGLCGATTTKKEWYSEDPSLFTDSAKYRVYGTGTSVPAIPLVSSQPKYIVEQMSTLGGDATASAVIGVKATTPPIAYKITAIGYGVRPESFSMLQSIFIKPAN